MKFRMLSLRGIMVRAPPRDPDLEWQCAALMIPSLAVVLNPAVGFVTAVRFLSNCRGGLQGDLL
jgi:hypothetical protein